ncbi:MAG: homoserine kinase, partial [Armatimonadetes bacterium]|nr:homoserine kinase [Armatimonadota bacterium]
PQHELCCPPARLAVLLEALAYHHRALLESLWCICAASTLGMAILCTHPRQGVAAAALNNHPVIFVAAGRVEVRVPATTANLGPGFDSLGLALNIYNRVVAWPAGGTTLHISGHGRDELPRDETNLMLRAARKLADLYGVELPPIRWQAHHDIPLARGLGSSSAAIVAGLLVARETLGIDVGREELVQIAAEIEGHPDNVAPALLGGLTVCLPYARPLRVARLRPHPHLRVVLCVPAMRVPTEKARRVLPASVPFEDAVFNLSRAAGLVAALTGGTWDLVEECTKDRLHQPYRMGLWRGAEDIMAAALAAGAVGAAASGSGPTVAAFCVGANGSVARAMLDAARRAGVEAAALVVRPDPCGARVNCRS